MAEERAGFRVTGVVQGVGFRWGTRRKGLELGLRGAREPERRLGRGPRDRGAGCDRGVRGVAFGRSVGRARAQR